MSFVPEDSSKNPAAGIIKEDGTYSVEVPVGNCKVMIDNRSAGKAFSPIGAGGVSGPPKEGKTGASGQGTTGPKMPSAAKGMKGPTGPTGPTGPPSGSGGGTTGPGAKASPTGGDEKGSNSAIADAMKGVGGEKAPDQILVPGKVVPINVKYLAGETSGLSIEVKGGSQTFDVKLEK